DLNRGLSGNGGRRETRGRRGLGRGLLASKGILVCLAIAVPGQFGASPAVSEQDHFHALGNSQLVENPEQVILDGVLGKRKALGDLAIGETFRDTSHHFLLAAGEQRRPTGI